MSRLPLWARLALISAGAILLLQLVALGVLATRDGGADISGIRQSFVRQVVGTVWLLERTKQPLRREIALEILNAGPLSVRADSRPPTTPDNGPIFSYLARQVAQKLAAAGLPRERITVSYVADNGGGPLAGLVGRQLQITYAQRDGTYLVIAPDSEGGGLVLGAIALIAGGILAVLLGGLVVFAIYRQTRPLGALAANMEQFARSAVPAPMQEAGAPEIRTLIRTANAMQQQVAALMRNRSVILAGMSHDLRTLITKLRLRLELLPPSDSRDRAIADIDAMQAMTEETLEFASAGSAADGGSADLNAIIARVHDAQSLATPGKISWSGGEGTLPVAMAETALRRIVQNLVDNAIAYGGQADIAASRAGGSIRLVIGDRGPGIPAASRSDIFEPYVRLDTSRSRAGGGTGLGLAIVKQIVDRHNGSISVADRPGGGSLFTVTLPPA